MKHYNLEDFTDFFQRKVIAMNSLKFHPWCRCVPVHGCNLAFLRVNCNAYKYHPAEISLFLRPIHNRLRCGFVMMFCLSCFLKRMHFVTLHKIFFHQIQKQEEIVKYNKENFMVFITLWLLSLICQILFDLGHLYVVILCINLFKKVFCNILNQKWT